jgi:eukaryotic-like serine/threonine-protein kinase
MAFSLKDYEILEEIGRGGFAQVFRARQKSLSREVAIKQLSPQRMQNAGEITRFRREAEAMASLTHDNIVAVFDYAFHNGNYYIVMEYIEGMAFDGALERGLPQECGLFVLEKAAAALTLAHSKNIVHRDIKPANLLLGCTGQVKLADFGLAQFHTGIESLSAPGSVLGTISYMAPEALVSPKEVDARVDVFSLGCILYQVIAGIHPFAGESFGEISYRLLNETPLPPGPGIVPAALADCVMRCLEKERDKRPSMQEVHDALAAATHDRDRASREKLITFVRQSPGTAGAAPAIPAVAIQNPPRAAGHKRRSAWRPMIVSGTAALVVCLLVLYYLSSGGHRHQHHAAPSFPADSVTGSPDIMEYDIPKSKGTKNVKNANNAPQPLVGAASDMKTGTLVFRGLGTGDTVLLNNTVIPPAQKGNDAVFGLVPGYYKVDIRRHGRPTVTREVELVPFERQVVDLSPGKER